ncbi:RraA family protein [Agromyces sp. NPDC056523]|uniref:RraA family protein n=1 Tax=Agromyces sp. NPDC056523 TaxID=3345850 RepID=UPI00366E165C
MTQAELIRQVSAVELPTLGHVLEDGFCDPGIRPVGEVGRMIGPAVTVDLVEPDAIAVNRALLTLRPGSVLVIRVASGRHAPVGAVTAAAARSRGAAGIVVEGPVTDASALRATADILPVYARGLTALTTKRLGTAVDGVGRDIRVGGVTVANGDLVAGDEHGVLVIDPESVDHVLLEAALRSDLAEPELLGRIDQGDDLGAVLVVQPENH